MKHRPLPVLEWAYKPDFRGSNVVGTESHDIKKRMTWQRDIVTNPLSESQWLKTQFGISVWLVSGALGAWWNIGIDALNVWNVRRAGGTT